MGRDALLEKLLLKNFKWYRSDSNVTKYANIFFLFHVTVILFFQKFALKGLLKFYL